MGERTAELRASHEALRDSEERLRQIAENAEELFWLIGADGRVVYVGGELRSYGNMVIVKHNETFLTAYAHAKTILVKEGTVVRQGQKIAEMGNSESDRVKLHFEIRKNGTAVDLSA